MGKQRLMKELINILREDGHEDTWIAHMLLPLEQFPTPLLRTIDEMLKNKEGYINIFDDDYYYYVEMTVKGKEEYMKLIFTDREYFTGYCMCKPTDEGYNEIHKCCGVSCDWDCPRITMLVCSNTDEEIISLKEEFHGLQRDLWKAKDRFIEEYFGDDFNL